MLQYSIYSVISPEGCASILWKSAEKAKEAAEALKLTAENLLELGLIDEVIDEPVGGAHRDIDTTVENITEALQRHLSEVKRSILSNEELLEQRYKRITAYGRFEE